MSFVFGDLFPDERSYRPGEVARRLGVHVNTVRRWIDEGHVSCFKLSGHRRIPYEGLRAITTEKLTMPHKNTTNLNNLP